MNYIKKDWYGVIALGIFYILLISFISHLIVSDKNLTAFLNRSAVLHGFIDNVAEMPPLARWDSVWYYAIAGEGFTGTSHLSPFTAAFLPLYPFLARLVSVIPTLDIYSSSLFVSRFSLLTSLWLLFLYCRDILGPKTNPWPVIVSFLAFPTAFITISMYSEGLFLALCLAAFYFLYKEKPYLSFLSAFGATLTRINGLALTPAFIVMTWVQWRNKKPYLPALFSAIAPLLSFLSQMYYFHFTFEEPLRYFTKKNAFGNQGINWPWQSIMNSVEKSLEAYHTLGIGAVYYYLEIPLLILIIVSAIILYRKKLLAECAFICSSAFLTVISGTLWGLPRFTVFLFPVFFVLGSMQRKNWLWYAYLFAAISIQIIVLVNYVLFGKPAP